MRFKIRYKDQIVGLLSFFAAGLIILIIILLGARQRWFSKDYHYKTILNTGAGLSSNMGVIYKGFTIGNVKSFYLLDKNNIEVDFIVYDEFNYLVLEGSLVELQISPIGLGNQFLFYSGRGPNQLDEETFIPEVSSKEGRDLTERGLTDAPNASDSISTLLSRVNSTLLEFDNALKGDSATTIGRTFLNIENSLAEVQQIAANVNKISGGFSDNTSAFYKSLETSLVSIAGILSSLDKTTSYLPADMPQITATITDLRSALRSAEDVLTGLSNNPLLKNGVSKRVQTGAGAANPRDIEF
ncbi:MAG: MCE family protein [Spirochaetaceae bacterium]|jgi:phospholipid/cholesterol/gamma-HCH transport system substrate-binding protein|nr:MCE family protein [Spirochaetaceae bacterium]